jgi:hypothetical protein
VGFVHSSACTLPPPACPLRARLAFDAADGLTLCSTCSTCVRLPPPVHGPTTHPWHATCPHGRHTSPSHARAAMQAHPTSSCRSAAPQRACA